MDPWLVPPEQRESTPHAYKRGRQVRPVELVIVHWTASPVAKGPHGDDPERMRRWLRGESGRESSTHFVVTRSGEILQGAPLTWRTWHAGGSRTIDGRGDVNQRSIGIDLESVGPLTRGTDRWVDAYGGTYHGPPPHERPEAPLDRVDSWSRRTFGQGRIEAWEPYRVAQIASFLHVALLLSRAIPDLVTPAPAHRAAHWLGHCEVRDTKLDPGPHFPWRTLAYVLAGAVSPGDVDRWHPSERRLLVDA